MIVKQLYFQHHKGAPYFFQDLSFHLEKGKIHALHGKNGVGKTVFLNILSGQIDKRAILKGEITGGKIALVKQQYDQMIADQFSFLENLQFSSFKPFPSLFSSLKQPHLYPELLEKFHIDFTTPAYKLSGGQRQILALLMVLQRKADILLLDEPTATLDEQNAIMVMEFLKTLQRVTVLIVCHDRELITRYTTGSHLFLEREPLGFSTLKTRA